MLHRETPANWHPSMNGHLYVSRLSLSGAAQQTCSCLQTPWKPALAMDKNKLVWSSRLRHVAINPHAWATAWHILAHHRIVICMGPGLQSLLCALHVVLLAHPGDDAGLLECLAVRKGQVPRHLGLAQLVHVAEVNGRHFLIVLVQRRLAGQEEDAREGRGDIAQQGLHSELGDQLVRSLGSPDAGLNHVGLQEAPREVDVVLCQRLELGNQDLLRHLRAVADVVRAVGHDLGLHDGHQPLALADRGVARQRVDGVGDGEVAGQALLWIELQDVAPLGEAGALLVGLLAALLEVVQALGGDLRVAERTDLRAPDALLVVRHVQLDAWNHAAVARNDVHHGFARRVLLHQGLPVQDHSADEVAQPRGGEAHGAIGGAVLYRVRDLLRLRVARTEPRAGGLVGGEKALARGTELHGGRLQLGQDVQGHVVGKAAAVLRQKASAVTGEDPGRHG
mmetsp:Transcript_70007/g.158875  ORF Transcript_70007/g.158875 Transcript_70007/m.158875 type:complete len:451 (-) Transcript_70007:72-1424(-)